MTEKGYMTDIYKQLQDVMNKCDNLSHELKTVKKETEKKYKLQIKKINEQHKKEITTLKVEIKTLKEDNQKLKNENDRLKKQLNNNSDNSSKPPSSDIKQNKKDIPNNREKSNKKVGGQVGHKGHCLSKKDVEDKINKKEYKHEVINVGEISNNYISKYVIDVQVSVIAKEYRFYQDTNGKYNIPKEFQTDVQYGSEIKTLCSVLNTEGIVAIDRLTDFVSSISYGKLNISNGSIVNFINQLKNKCNPIIQKIEEKILNSDIMYTDATTARCNNRNICVRNYSTEKYTLLKATIGKGKKYILESNILPKYTGDLVHDHETVMYNYGKEHVECNVHISRYLKGCYENTKNNWCKDMRNFLVCLNEYKKKIKGSGKKSIPKDKLERYSLRYDEILKKGFEENKKVKSKFYKKEEKKILNRMKKYKRNHLLYIYNFDLPFDNNLSERELRHVKSKQKISGYFKSMTGIQGYLDIKSIIITCKKCSLDFYELIRNIFDNTPVTIM